MGAGRETCDSSASKLCIFGIADYVAAACSDPNFIANVSRYYRKKEETFICLVSYHPQIIDIVEKLKIDFSIMR
jgi:hypothetical protein